MTADEFQICMEILAATKLGTTPKGQSELVALAAEQAELNAEEEPVIIEDEHVERFILCATHCLPYFSVSVLFFVFFFVRYSEREYYCSSSIKKISVTIRLTRILNSFQTQIESTPFIKYACERLFPLHTWNLIGANGDKDQEHLRILKVFAEMSAFCGTLEAPNLKIDAIFNVLQVISHTILAVNLI